MSIADGTHQRVPDVELLDRINSALDSVNYPELKGIRCLASDCNVSLVGTISSYYLKQVAQTTVLQVSGVRRVDNQLMVRP
ncbi:MAG: BON domain-containing protein [Planctomycetaceae bacterium]|nr:BON domain-containing protein [Planctomycetaceae bacterium]